MHIYIYIYIYIYICIYTHTCITPSSYPSRAPILVPSYNLYSYQATTYTPSNIPSCNL